MIPLVIDDVKPRASDYVESLVSGLPSREREGWWIMVLQGYFDDGGSHSKDTIYALAGFISTIEKWKTFSEAWRAKLDEFPSLPYFKMSEANSRKGQFSRGWTPATRDQRVFELAELIKSHVMVRVTSTLTRVDFDLFCKGIVDLPEMNDPYLLCFYQLLYAVNTFQLEHGAVSCDLVFDDQGVVGRRSLLWWDAGKDAKVKQERIDILNKMNPAIFRNDKVFLPLQAADMLAWITRECQTDHTKINFLWKAIVECFNDLPGIDRRWHRDELMEIGAKALVYRARELGFLR